MSANLALDSTSEFKCKLLEAAMFFAARYQQGNGRPPEPHVLDHDALVTLVFDEAAGRIDVARMLIDEIFSAGFGGERSFFEAWLLRAWWNEQGCPKGLRSVPHQVRAMFEENAMRTCAVVERLERERVARMWRAFA